MNVEELIEKLEKIEDKTLEVRVIEGSESGKWDQENYWVRKVEVSNTGDSGYYIEGEVRLIGEE